MMINKFNSQSNMVLCAINNLRKTAFILPLILLVNLSGCTNARQDISLLPGESFIIFENISINNALHSLAWYGGYSAVISDEYANEKISYRGKTMDLMSVGHELAKSVGYDWIRVNQVNSFASTCRLKQLPVSSYLPLQPDVATRKVSVTLKDIPVSNALGVIGKGLGIHVTQRNNDLKLSAYILNQPVKDVLFATSAVTASTFRLNESELSISRKQHAEDCDTYKQDTQPVTLSPPIYQPGSCFRMNHPVLENEPPCENLEYYSNEDISLKGMMAHNFGKETQFWAIFEDGSKQIQFVHIGNKIGENGGEIIKIDADGVVVLELYSTGKGKWSERERRINYE